MPIIYSVSSKSGGEMQEIAERTSKNTTERIACHSFSWCRTPDTFFREAYVYFGSLWMIGSLVPLVKVENFPSVQS